jgi:hypothetical protein
MLRMGIRGHSVVVGMRARATRISSVTVVHLGRHMKFLRGRMIVQLRVVLGSDRVVGGVAESVSVVVGELGGDDRVLLRVSLVLLWPALALLLRLNRMLLWPALVLLLRLDRVLQVHQLRIWSMGAVVNAVCGDWVSMVNRQSIRLLHAQVRVGGLRICSVVVVKVLLFARAGIVRALSAWFRDRLSGWPRTPR